MEKNLNRGHPLGATASRPIPAYFFPLLGPDDACDAQDAERFASLLNRPARPRRTLVYVHVPFCHSHCSFCSFYRRTVGNDDPMLATYVDRVLDELSRWIDAGTLSCTRIEAVYVGGGTPSVLPPAHARRLVSGLRRALPLPADTEISFEGEARTLSNPVLVAALREAGVTRLSFGVQSFDREVRRASGIRASLDDVRACIETLRRFDYPVCMDLMYGLPGQTLSVFAQDLVQAVEREAAVLIDLYGAILYPTAPLMQSDQRAERQRLPHGAAAKAMYEQALEYLATRGYRQITFEDFCQPAGEYRMKDLTYGGEDGEAQTLALGSCAVGYLAGHSYRNQVLESYLAGATNILPLDRLRQASSEERRRRALFFYPRRLMLDLGALEGPVAPRDRAALDAHVADGFATRTGDRYVLTRKGRTHADDLVRTFLRPEEHRKLFRLVQ